MSLSIMQDPQEYIQDFQGSMSQADVLNEEKRASFDGGNSRKCLLKKGMVLHRFIGMNSDGKLRCSFSDCWIDEPTFESMLRELQNATEQAMFTGSDEQKRDGIRQQLALKTDWNTISERVKVVLKQDVVAHLGLIGPQYVYVDVDVTKPADSKRAKMHAAVVNFQRPKYGNAKVGSVKIRVEIRKGGTHTQYVIPRFKGLDEENSNAEVLHRAEVFKNRGIRKSG